MIGYARDFDTKRIHCANVASPGERHFGCTDPDADYEAREQTRRLRPPRTAFLIPVHIYGIYIYIFLFYKLPPPCIKNIHIYKIRKRL